MDYSKRSSPTRTACSNDMVWAMKEIKTTAPFDILSFLSSESFLQVLVNCILLPISLSRETS